MNKKVLDIVFILFLSFVMGVLIASIHPGKNGKKITLIKYSQLLDDKTRNMINELTDTTKFQDTTLDSSFTMELEEPKEIYLDVCKNLFDSQKAIFIDARDSISYKEGYIKSAFNIDWAADVAYQYEFLEDISFNNILVIYCSGGDCDLSRELGNELFFQGYKTVFLYEGGYPEWQEMGYPIESDE